MALEIMKILSGSRRRLSVRYGAVAPVVAMLAACGGPAETAHKPSEQVIVTKQTVSMLHIPQDPPVELGKIPPAWGDHPSQHAVFRYPRLLPADHAQDRQESKGPAYESCAEDQEAYRSVIGETIDAEKFQNDVIIHCAKATRSAYQGEWYCLNNQEY